MEGRWYGWRSSPYETIERGQKEETEEDWGITLQKFI